MVNSQITILNFLVIINILDYHISNLTFIKMIAWRFPNRIGYIFWNYNGEFSSSKFGTKKHLADRRIPNINYPMYMIIPAQNEGYIDGATTRLCMPTQNKMSKSRQLTVKKGWFHKDCMNETWKNNQQGI